VTFPIRLLFRNSKDNGNSRHPNTGNIFMSNPALQITVRHLNDASSVRYAFITNQTFDVQWFCRSWSRTLFSNNETSAAETRQTLWLVSAEYYATKAVNLMTQTSSPAKRINACALFPASKRFIYWVQFVQDPFLCVVCRNCTKWA